MVRTIYKLTLRHWAELFRSPMLYCGFVLFVILGAIAGPHNPYLQMGIGEAVLFSLGLNTFCWALGLLLGTPFRYTLEALGLPPRIAIICTTSILCFILVPLVWAVFAYVDGSDYDFVYVAQQTALFAVIISLISLEINRQADKRWKVPPSQLEEVSDQSSKNSPEVPGLCPLQKKLPSEKRGVLYAIVAQDHYVEMITDKGSHLLLMRMVDAVAQTNKNKGMQIHRSAWVSRAGMVELRREGRRHEVQLPNGRSLPVSRSKVAAATKFFDHERSAAQFGQPSSYSL